MDKNHDLSPGAATDEPASPSMSLDAGEPPAPWDRDEADPPDPDQRRKDAFTGRRKRKFLKALTKTGCALDACRIVGISNRTAYNHYDSDPEFARLWRLALEMAGTDIELLAWERAVNGVEEEVIQYGKVVGTRLRRSDAMLRLLLQGSNRKKYGPRPGFSRKRLLKHERKRMEREMYAQMAAEQPSIEEVRDTILRRLDAIQRHAEPRKLAAGWIKDEDGNWIPPGWVRASEAGGRAEPGDVGDSV